MNDKIAGILKNLRTKKGEKEEKLAYVLEISIDKYQRYEMGLEQPDVTELIRVADYFDVSTDYLLGRDDDPQSHKIKEVNYLAGKVKKNKK